MIKQRTQKSKEQLEFWKRLKISELGLRIVMVFVIVIGGTAYLLLTNSVATSGLQLKDLNDRLERLSTDRSVLQAEVDRLQSMDRLDRVTKSLDLVKVSNVDYLTEPTGAVASR